MTFRRLPPSLRPYRIVPPAGVPLASRTGTLEPRRVSAPISSNTRPDFPTADHAGRCEADPARCVNVVRQAGHVHLATMDRNGATTTREDC